MANEIEVKLIAEQQVVKSLLDMSFEGVSAIDPWQTSELKNTYFDTVNFKLRELKIGLRIRADGEKLIQTVKASGRAIGGLHERNESETELDEFKIDINKVEDPYLKILLEEALTDCGELDRVFTTNFTRHKTLFYFDDGTEIEVALDVGHIYYEDDSCPISEVELELVTGDPKHLFSLSRRLISEHGFAISNASKARRGYSLCSSLPVTHRKMSVIELSSGTEAEKAFEIICYSGLKHWQYYEQFLDSSLAPDAILQMYRALLYIQHVYQVFGSLIPRHATSDLRANWEWMAGFMDKIVTVARERNHIKQMLEQELASEEELAQVVAANKAELAEAVAKFKELKASPRYNLVMLGISEWLFFKQWQNFIEEGDKEKLKAPIIDFAKAQLEHALKELRREFGPKIKLDTNDYLVQVDRLRKALDIGLFFGGLFDSKKRQQYRQPWLDLMAGTRELALYKYVCHTFKAHKLRDDKDIEHWFDRRSESVLEAMEQTRKAMFKARPYWLL
ncbi:CYTH domain-containing protein [Pleionea mediterranea]|jgi:triphosphatase|uniref:Triphosphatase n=1 Tax=Pleionea mediterranea TaxID=523701 RepID=A0A316G0V8_9GAMM|nr:CYTH domain-containing protein [Pleionea mediterranea]PWK53985.1 triphosphatase [Pleionea mediterranea]